MAQITCPTCRGRKYVPKPTRMGAERYEYSQLCIVCPTCQGRPYWEVSCCDGATGGPDEVTNEGTTPLVEAVNVSRRQDGQSDLSEAEVQRRVRAIADVCR